MKFRLSRNCFIVNEPENAEWKSKIQCATPVPAKVIHTCLVQYIAISNTVPAHKCTLTYFYFKCSKKKTIFKYSTHLSFVRITCKNGHSCQEENETRELLTINLQHVLKKYRYHTLRISLPLIWFVKIHIVDSAFRIRVKEIKGSFSLSTIFQAWDMKYGWF